MEECARNMEESAVKNMALEELILDLVRHIQNLEGVLDVPPKEQHVSVHRAELCNALKTRSVLTDRSPIERAGS
jgi:hypothetical protein